MKSIVVRHKGVMGLFAIAVCSAFVAFPLIHAQAQDATDSAAQTDFSRDVLEAQQDAIPESQLSVTGNQDVSAGEVGLDDSIRWTPVVDTSEEMQPLFGLSPEISGSEALDTIPLSPSFDAFPGADDLSQSDLRSIEAQASEPVDYTGGGDTSTSGIPSTSNESGTVPAESENQNTTAPSSDLLAPPTDTGTTDQGASSSQ